MQEEKSTSFLITGTFEANPYLYDYLHSLRFSPAGVIEMLDGAGQVLNTLVKGRFSVQAGDQNTASVYFYDLREVDPYNEQEQLRELNTSSIKITREEGTFSFKQQVVWKIHDENEWPCLLYRVRYIFEVDPLEQTLTGRAGNLYYHIEAKEPDTRFYYRRDDAQQLTARELFQMGISISQE
jgi:hypothetical protein